MAPFLFSTPIPFSPQMVIKEKGAEDPSPGHLSFSALYRLHFAIPSARILRGSKRKDCNQHCSQMPKNGCIRPIIDERKTDFWGRRVMSSPFGR